MFQQGLKVNDIVWKKDIINEPICRSKILGDKIPKMTVSIEVGSDLLDPSTSGRLVSSLPVLSKSTLPSTGDLPPSHSNVDTKYQMLTISNVSGCGANDAKLRDVFKRRPLIPLHSIQEFYKAYVEKHGEAEKKSDEALKFTEVSDKSDNIEKFPVQTKAKKMFSPYGKFSCRFCGKVFSRPFCVNRHAKIQHPREFSTGMTCHQKLPSSVAFSEKSSTWTAWSTPA